VYRDIFNGVLVNGLPEEWRKAKVIALQKKPKIVDISNFRPISNLCSLEKLFEKCVLNRLAALGYDNLMGKHQHGFRPLHSTTTCLLDIKTHITSALDKKKDILMYAVDLNAAFDMLRKMCL